VVDEAFIDATPAASLAGHGTQAGLIVLRSLGKFFGLAGARVGFVLAANDLLQALSDSLDEFGRRSQIVFDLDNRFPDGLLDDEEELQILQIVREALANIVRHSHARSARIELRQADGALCVQVEDDGIGLQGGCAEGNHFGLSIMQERAASIGASLRVEGLLPQGTRVGLWLALGERGADHGQGQYQEEPASASQRHLAADR
jgi:two-component system nitrate/nitrite sensor histidine kinase NarX